MRLGGPTMAIVTACVVSWGCNTNPSDGDTKSAVVTKSKPAKRHAVKVRRPASLQELRLTPDRRVALERAWPIVRGFKEASAVEAELVGLDLDYEGRELAVSALDQRAQGDWLLWLGEVVEPNRNGFSVVMRFKPVDESQRDRGAFKIRFENIEGYRAESYREGMPIAVLAKYRGRQLAMPGYDLLSLDRWYQGRRVVVAE